MIKGYKFVNGTPKTICPACGRKRFSRLVDYFTEEITEYGRCDRIYSCGYVNLPTPSETRSEAKAGKAQNVTNNVFDFNVKSKRAQLTSENEKNFTLTTSIREGSKAIEHLSLIEVIELLNSLPKTQKKEEQASILQGLYKLNERTISENCVKTAPFIFFDIDYKPSANLNAFLSDSEARDVIKKELCEMAVAVWDSFSGYGLAGILYAPSLSTLGYDKKDLYKKLTKQVYELVEDILLLFTGFVVRLDCEQGKFRQIRYLARQKEPIYANKNFEKFFFESKKIIEVEAMTQEKEALKEVLIVENENSKRLCLKYLQDKFDIVSLEKLELSFLVNRGVVFVNFDTNVNYNLLLRRIKSVALSLDISDIKKALAQMYNLDEKLTLGELLQQIDKTA